LRLIENGMLRTIFGPNRYDVKGERRKLHNEEPKGLYSSPKIMWVIKSRRMRMAGHVALWGRERSVQGAGGETRGV